MNLRKLTVSTIAAGFLICGSAAQAASYQFGQLLAGNGPANPYFADLEITDNGGGNWTFTLSALDLNSIFGSSSFIGSLADYLGKLAENILNNRDIKVSVGYILIYLTALTRVLNYCFRDCLEKAYSRVKRNKDIMFDGNYVGMKDEKYAEAKSLVKNRRLNHN